MPGRTFTREFKLEVVRQLASGAKHPAQVCREQQLVESVLARWRREYAERGEAAVTPRSGAGVDASQTPLETRIAELERFCGQLALENAALKKALQSRAATAPIPSGNSTP
ncbi:MAG: transposase [Ktedonobacterales bacterium]